MTAQIVEWIPIEEMPEAYRDGRPIIVLTHGREIHVVERADWGGSIALVWEYAYNPGEYLTEKSIAYFMPMLLLPDSLS